MTNNSPDEYYVEIVGGVITVYDDAGYTKKSKFQPENKNQLQTLGYIKFSHGIQIERIEN